MKFWKLLAFLIMILSMIFTTSCSEYNSVNSQLEHSDSESRLNQYITDGDQQIKDKNYGLAIKDFQSALDIDPNCAEAYYGLGRVYRSQKEWEEAVSNLKRAVEFKSDYVEAYRELSSIYWHRDIDLALLYISQAIKIKPDDTNLYGMREMMYTDKNDWDNVIADCTKIIAIDPDKSHAYYNRGYAYANKGMFDLAIKNYNRAIELKPDDSTYILFRGIAYWKKDDEYNARRDFERVIELEDNDPESLNKIDAKSARKYLAELNDD